MVSADALPLSPATRRWSLAAAIASIAVFGINIGFTTPLLSLLLDRRGIDPTVNGLNAASAFLGVILGPLLTPPIVRRLGLRRFLLGCLALDIGLFLLMKPLDGLAAWFVLRLALGIIGAAIFTATEVWINLLAEEPRRGRIIGLYAAALNGGFALGPALLAVTGIEGWRPFLAASLVTLAAMLPLLRAEPGRVGRAETRGAGPLAMFARAPIALLTAGLFGVIEQSYLSLLPVWGVRLGMTAISAGALLTATAAGGLAVQPMVGWLSDKIPRRRLLLLSAGIGLAGGALIVPAAGVPLMLYGLLFLWSGVTGSLYPLALGMLGERFTGAELVSANAAMIICYGVGGLLGPSLGGVAMDLWTPHGLILWLLAVLAVLFLAATVTQPRDRV
jgi:MFS family permease